MSIIDVEIPLKGRNIQRLVAMPIVIFIFVFLSFLILPDNDRFFDYSSNEEFGFRAFIAHVILLQCLWHILKEIVFTIRSRVSSGSWKIYLDENVFRWESPKHFWGKETDFEFNLNDIEKIERHLYSGKDDLFWLYPENAKRIRVKDYCGLSLPWVFEKLKHLGVEYTEKSFSDSL